MTRLDSVLPVRAGRRDLAVRARATAWAATTGRDLAPFAGFALLALLLRLLLIDARPLHHDESEHAWFAWRFVNGEGYRYDPVFHGPVQFYLMSLADLALGAGDRVARVAPATMGAAITFLPWFLRRQLGRTAMLAAAAALCLAPSYLYFSRFAREDVYVACITLALMVVLLRFLAEPRRWHPSALLGLLAASFATKETTYITSFLIGTFLIGATVAQAARERRRGGRVRDAPLLRTAASVGRDAWAWGVATFLVVFTLLFSTFLTNPAGLQEGLVGSIHYWLTQQPVGRGGQPWFYYLILLPAYEWPLLLLGIAGIGGVLRRPTLAGGFLIWMFLGSLAVYSWASERMPWLILHPLLPLILLAGLGVQAAWNGRRRWSGRLVLALAAVGALVSIWTAVAVSYVRPTDPRELLVQVQTAEDVPRIRDELVALDARVRRQTGAPLELEVDSWGGTGWPWSWYLRDHPIGYSDMSSPLYRPTGQAILVADPNHAAVAPKLAGYVGKRFNLRVWWVPDYGAASPVDWARWLVRREAWNPTATMDEWLYVERGLARP
jgi:uncharacterized protein (TIGR03663 family)